MKVPSVETGLLTLTAGLTRYIVFGDSNLASASAAVVTATQRTAGTYSRLYAKVISNTLTAPTTIQIRKNGIVANQSITITAGQIGESFDLINTDSVVSGDTFDAIIISGGTGTNIQLNIVAVLFESTTNIVKRFVASGSQTSGATFNGYQALGGLSSIASLEIGRQVRAKFSATLKNYAVEITANARVADIPSGTRINGNNGTVAVNLVAGTTGLSENTVNSDALVNGDLFDHYLGLSADANNLTYRLFQVDLIATTKDTLMINSGTGPTVNANLTRYFPVGGSIVPDATESNVQTVLQGFYRASGLQMRLTPNTVTLASILRLRINGAYGNQIVMIPPSTAGIFEDAEHNDIILPTDQVSYELITGATGTSMVLQTFAMTLSQTNPRTIATTRSPASTRSTASTRSPATIRI